MTIVLYRCTAENHRVDKSQYISNSWYCEGTLRESSSVINPVITMEKTNPAANLYNYMYIPEFKRWYYINDIVSINNGLWQISAHVDVLYTWGADILKTSAVIDRTGDRDKANAYINDGSIVAEARRWSKVIPFQNGFSGNSMILIAAGGE